MAIERKRRSWGNDGTVDRVGDEVNVGDPALATRVVGGELGDEELITRRFGVTTGEGTEPSCHRLHPGGAVEELFVSHTGGVGVPEIHLAL